MTISVGELFDKCGLHPAGVVKWGQQVPLDAPGVYVVASTPDIRDSSGALRSYSHNPAAFEMLRDVCPAVEIDGKSATGDEMAARVGAFWIPDSAVLYIGRAGTSVQKRVRQYYVTRIGQRSPHAGGWWLKTLAGLDDLFVHYASASDAKSVETALISAFAESVPLASVRNLHDLQHLAPFANVEVRPGVRKRHGMANYKLT
ncbi:hypothetical protein [Arthrobacter sp. UYEF21]|uniref:hypothetical protein n=1 Tax=Arthrobacter sp. UYEF21 TaxID=1756364 RepID=UPI00339439C3